MHLPQIFYDKSPSELRAHGSTLTSGEDQAHSCALYLLQALHWLLPILPFAPQNVLVGELYFQDATVIL